MLESEDPIEFKAFDVDDLYESSYLDFRDRLSSMSEKDRNNPKKMQRMKRAVEENSGFLAEGEIEEVLEEFNFEKVDPSNPKTWQKIGDKFDIGRPNLVSEKMAAGVEVDAYRKQVQAMEGLDRPALDLVEEQVSSFAGRILGQAGVDPSRTLLRDDYRLNYNKTMSGIYEQILEGVDPINALQNNIRTLGLPKEFDDFLINRVYSISDAAAAGIDFVEAVPYPKITKDIIDNITDEPVYFPAKEVIKTTEAVPSAEPEPKLRGDLVNKRAAAASAVPNQAVSAPSLDDLKKAGAGVESTTSAPSGVTPQQQAFLDSMKAQKAAGESAAVDALPATKKSVEEGGYLYHYAPREARESILSGGLQTSQARTAVGDVAGEFADFSGHVPENGMYFFTDPNDAPSAGTIFGTGDTGQKPDLYRVKVEPGMLDDMVVDPRLPIRDGVASAVIVPSKTGSFAAELIGENAEFGVRGTNVSPATYDPIVTEKPKSGPLKVGTSADLRTAPSDIGTDAASSGGKVTASGATHTAADTVDLTTNNTNPTTTKPKAQAKIDSQNTAGGRTAGTQRSSGPGPTRKSKDMLDNGLRTAQDLAGGNARLMGIAAAAGLLGIGVVASRKKNNPAPDRGTYLDQSRRDSGY